MDATATYQRFAQFYDQYVHGFIEDLQFYTALCRPDDRIAEIGCGTGRVLKQFLDDGFRITGVDISQEMLAVAQQKLGGYLQHGQLRLVQQDLLEAPLPEPYDKLLVTFYTFNYILDQPEQFLRNLVLSMTDQAVLVMDLFYPKTLYRKDLEGVWTTQEIPYQGKAVRLRDQRTMVNKRETRIQLYEFDGQETRIETVRRYFPPEEIRKLLVQAGFREVVFSAQHDTQAFAPSIDEKQLNRSFIVKAQK